MKGKYDDIINLPHFKSPYHKPMTSAQRAGQFGSFKALTGYEEEIKKQEIIYDEEVLVGEDEAKEINDTLLAIRPLDKVVVTYFVDQKYQTIEGWVSKIEVDLRYLVVDDHKIEFSTIRNIQWEIEEEHK